MKKTLAITCFCFSTFILFGQNVGINKPNPEAKLDVNGNVKITDGTQGNGEVLTSDANGLASWQSTKTVFTLETNAAIATNDYVGLGSSSSNFIRNTIVVPFNCEITSLTCSVRNLAAGTYTCTIWVKSGISATPPVSTGIQATVNPGGYFAISPLISYPLSLGDLLSVRFTSASGSLIDGIAASISYK